MLPALLVIWLHSVERFPHKALDTGLLTPHSAEQRMQPHNRGLADTEPLRLLDEQRRIAQERLVASFACVPALMFQQDRYPEAIGP